ncbi:MAG: hypothetical protein AAGA75_09050 [Cyanobacteria bacterium P01_E01_bin.6]
MARVNLNFDPVQRAAGSAWRDTAFLFHRKLIEEISANKWTWPTQPSPRDIVDTGTLKGNQQPPKFSPDGFTATFRNNTEYAVYVHEGVTFRNGTQLPGRPWTQTALQSFDVEGTFSKLLETKI